MLDKCEWDFSKIDQSKTEHAFYYEYARQSERIKDAVEKYREHCRKYYHKEFADQLMILKPDITKEQQAECTKAEEGFQGNLNMLILWWLSECTAFPDKPFLVAEAQELAPFQDLFFNLPGLIETSDYAAEEDVFDEMSDAPNVTEHLMSIDWNQTDSELKEQFASFLKEERTTNGRKSRKREQRTIFNRTLELPKECKKMSTALLHLGKLRRMEHAGSWNAFLQELIDNGEKGENRRYHEKDVSAARKVIEWIENTLIAPE